jgi:Ni/Fe-hydrogenase subunit HybB-like protein
VIGAGEIVLTGHDLERPGPAPHQVTRRVSEIVEGRPSRAWILLLAFVLGLLCLLVGALARVVGTGIGVWGNNQAVAWAWDITGFVFWIGIGHAGTLISAILFLFRQQWRTSVSRAAEAVTLFAVMTAAIYPLFHLGRVWLAYWMLPLPNQMKVWPNFKSPLMWDVFAISTYFAVSVMFWYVGLVPDLATLRDRSATARRRRLLGWLSLGWHGSQKQWLHHEKAYLILAGLATPLVLSVHSIVSFDFAVSVVPGWHSTIFPPYFVAGAVLSGSAMVVLLMVLVRKALGLEEFITLRHLESMNKLVLATGTMVAYSYGVELFLAWLGGDVHEQSTLFGRATGSQAAAFWAMLFCNVLLPQLYWSRRVRRSLPWMVVISAGVTVGMWLERLVIIVTGLDRGYLPATWSEFHPTWVDVATLAGTFGLFLTLFVLFVRFVPVMSMSEVKGVLSGEEPEATVTAEHSQDSDRAPAGIVLMRPRSVNVQWLVGAFDEAAALRRACEDLRAAGVHAFDAHTPFPVGGLTRSMRLGPSKLPRLCFACGVVGGVAALVLQWWIGIDYPMTLGGKPAWTLPAYVPITFEVTILSAALACFCGLWAISGLGRSRHPALRQPEFLRATDDRFLVSVESTDPQYRSARALLSAAGARELFEVRA